MAVKMLMKGAILPGNSTVEMKDFEVPKPGHGQVLIKTKATTICGSDIRCIYREHTGKGPEGYIPGMVAGHEPCGQIVEEGEGLKRFKKGDRVIVYHISGGGVCNEGKYLLDPLLEIIEREQYSRYGSRKTKIAIASLGNDAGLIGAAMLGR